MSQYYLMSQLPSLDGLADTVPLPITEERFLELCSRFLPTKTFEVIKNLTLIPPFSFTPTGYNLIDEWYQNERNLRLALAKVRANKLNKNFQNDGGFIRSEFLQIAQTAQESENPLEAERFLDRYRAEMLEQLRPMDAFSTDAVFYYGLKLKLVSRIRLFDSEKGQKAYQEIYNSIISSDEKET